jgi:4-amino-4-deoxy-L-arabinose transferase-like glycosyltransferase
MLVAAAARLPTLAEQSFWLDEAYTERLVRMSLGSMLRAIPSSESTPPLYYVLAWCWTHIFGYTELGIRSLSAVAGIVTVPVVYAVARRLADRAAAVIAASLVAVSPLLVWYSQEARAYALATLLAGVSLLCFVSFLGTRRRGWLAGWAAASALGMATHYFVGFVVAPEVLWLLWAVRHDRRVLAAGVFVVAVAVALVPLALAQRGTGHADYISQGSLTTRALQIPKQFLTGYASPSQLISSALAACLCVAGVLSLLRRAQGRARTGALVPLVVGGACILIPFVLALVGVDFLNTRNVLPALPPLMVVLAIGFAALPRPAGVAVAGGLSVISVVVLALVDTNPRYQRDDWRGVSRALGAADRARAIVVSPGSGWIPLRVYQPGVRPLRRAPVTELDLVAVPAQVLGGGIAMPPRPHTPPPVPAGFRLTRVVYAETYTVLRFRAAKPVAVTPAALTASPLSSGAAADLVEESRSSALH